MNYDNKINLYEELKQELDTCYCSKKYVNFMNEYVVTINIYGKTMDETVKTLYKTSERYNCEVYEDGGSSFYNVAFITYLKKDNECRRFVVISKDDVPSWREYFKIYMVAVFICFVAFLLFMIHPVVMLAAIFIDCAIAISLTERSWTIILKNIENSWRKLKKIFKSNK